MSSCTRGSLTCISLEHNADKSSMGLCEACAANAAGMFLYHCNPRYSTVNLPKKGNASKLNAYVLGREPHYIALNALIKIWPPDAMAAASNVYSYKCSQDAGGMYTNMFASRSPGLFGSSWNPFMKQ